MNLRPSGYEPDELPGCSTPRRKRKRRTLRHPGLRLRRRIAKIERSSSIVKRLCFGLGGPGGDLLSRVLRQSTIGAEAFDGRVRDGIGSDRFARATRPAKAKTKAKQTGVRRTEDGRRRISVLRRLWSVVRFDEH